VIDFKNIFLTINRINSTFHDDDGVVKTGSGTGFFIRHNDIIYFITNRHNVVHINPKKPRAKYTLDGIKIWLRTDGSYSIDSSTQEYEIDLKTTKIIKHETADLALFCHIGLKGNANLARTNPIVSDCLADLDFFNTKLQPIARCVFIGYPLISEYPIWDEERDLPIARGAELSSLPCYDFMHKGVSSSHARLVSGLSFGGSSGSPILNLGTEISAGEGVVLHNAVEPKLIGIMAGHWWDDNSLPDFIRKHTGLSYFVSSMAIWELLESNTLS
jgi:hypothetical protein